MRGWTSVRWPDVSLVLVTRGDVPIDHVVIPARAAGITDVVVWDNSTKLINSYVYGRFLALAEVVNDVVMFLDDDVEFTAYDELLASYEPGVAVVNMNETWIEAGHYEETALFGAGSIVDKDILLDALRLYQSVFPIDPWLPLECDLIVGTLVPFRVIDIGYDVKPWAKSPDRLCRQPWQTEQKMLAMERARFVRDNTGGSDE